MQRERWPEALRAFDWAIECDDSEATAWINRATLPFPSGAAEPVLPKLGPTSFEVIAGLACDKRKLPS